MVSLFLYIPNICTVLKYSEHLIKKLIYARTEITHVIISPTSPTIDNGHVVLLFMLQRVIKLFSTYRYEI